MSNVEGTIFFCKSNYIVIEMLSQQSNNLSSIRKGRNFDFCVLLFALFIPKIHSSECDFVILTMLIELQEKTTSMEEGSYTKDEKIIFPRRFL